MLNLVAIALGAAIGANLRYGLSTWPRSASAPPGRMAPFW